jgi:hypothetical protein
MGPDCAGGKYTDIELLRSAIDQRIEQRRSEPKNGLTDLQRLFLFGKLSGLNDKDAALAAGYSLSVAENTKQRIWKPQVRSEYERVKDQCMMFLGLTKFRC